LARDRTKVTVSGFTQLGLVELTRKRTRESLAHMLCEPCPTCAGKGQVKTARSVCYDILREILREAKQFNPKEFRIIATPAVVEMLLDEESQHLAGLSDFIGKPISLRAENAGLAGKLRAKESDRIAALVSNFQKLGFSCDEFPDGFAVTERLHEPKSLVNIETFGDHRIAMSFYIASLVSNADIALSETASIPVSFPNFFDVIESLQS
jgi:hypothetical protein